MGDSVNHMFIGTRSVHLDAMHRSETRSRPDTLAI
jgi:hypothetical protein